MPALAEEVARFRTLGEMGVTGWRTGSGTLHLGHPDPKLTRGVKHLGRSVKRIAKSLWARVKRASRSISPRPPSETHKPEIEPKPLKLKATPKPLKLKATPKPSSSPHSALPIRIKHPIRVRPSHRRIDVNKSFKSASAIKKHGLREAIEMFRTISEAKAGDYVTTTGGDKGYVQSVEKGRLAVKRVGGKASAMGDIFYVDSKDATVNPGGPPL